jgi:hypothetical protein
MHLFLLGSGNEYLSPVGRKNLRTFKQKQEKKKRQKKSKNVEQSKKIKRKLNGCIRSLRSLIQKRKKEFKFKNKF